jgi:limonene-1,2-epoxide hydrolase
MRLLVPAVFAAAVLTGCGGARSPADVVRAWGKALNAGDNEAAARQFAADAKVVAGDSIRVLHNEQQAVAFNANLPCGGRIDDLEAVGAEVTATIVLADRGNHRCHGAGERAAIVFRVRDGRIALFNQVGAGAPARVVVTRDGRIGPLRVDDSDRTDVVSLAGRPNGESRGRYSDYPAFDALGYGCPKATATYRDGVPRCKTVFYLDARSRELELLYTEDARYAANGVGPGTPTAVAERRLHRRAFVGCYSGFRLESPRAFLVMWLAGSKTGVGDHVEFLVVHSRT